MTLDCFARRVHFVDHLAPVWRALPLEARGTFWVPEALVDYARIRGVDATGVAPVRRQLPPLEVWPQPGRGPVLCCAYGDIEQVWKADRRRPLILMEHGVGLTPGNSVDGREVLSPGYAGGGDLRKRVVLFLATNEFIAAKTRRAIPRACQVVVGTPKMDRWANPVGEVVMSQKIIAAAAAYPEPYAGPFGRAALAWSHKVSQNYVPATATEIRMLMTQRPRPVVAISWHWDGHRVCPEAGNAWKYFKRGIPALCGRYHVLGHGHPKIMDFLAKEYEALGCGIEIVRDFEEVLERADVYVNDASSTLYEFSCTGKPVVVCNAPWFRRNVDYGIRFWRWSDVGVECNEPGELLDAVALALEDRPEQQAKRRKAVADLYPYLGRSAEVAAAALVEFLKQHEKETP